MANRSRMDMIPPGIWERAEWLDERLHRMLREIPLHFGLQGISDLEAELFPRRHHLPLDPRCPLCGIETDDGSIERRGDEFRVLYHSCGHESVMSAAELEARCHASAA